MSYHASVYRRGDELPIVARPHLTKEGVGVTLDGKTEQWTEIYCHDDECNWQVRLPSEHLGAVVVQPVEEPSA